jgi:soluble cytochrome b562
LQSLSGKTKFTTQYKNVKGETVSEKEVQELERKLDIVIEQNRQLLEKQTEHGERLNRIEDWQRGTQSFVDRITGGKMLTTWILTVFAGAGGIMLALAHIFWPTAQKGTH